MPANRLGLLPALMKPIKPPEESSSAIAKGTLSATHRNRQIHYTHTGNHSVESLKRGKDTGTGHVVRLRFVGEENSRNFSRSVAFLSPSRPFIGTPCRISDTPGQ